MRYLYNNLKSVGIRRYKKIYIISDKTIRAIRLWVSDLFKGVKHVGGSEFNPVMEFHTVPEIVHSALGVVGGLWGGLALLKKAK